MTDPQTPVPVPEIETLIAALRADAAQCFFENQSEVYAGALSKRLTEAADALTSETQRRQEADVEQASWRRVAERLQSELTTERTARQQAERERATLIGDFNAAKALLQAQLTAATEAREKAEQERDVWKGEIAAIADIIDLAEGGSVVEEVDDLAAQTDRLTEALTASESSREALRTALEDAHAHLVVFGDWMECDLFKHGEGPSGGFKQRVAYSDGAVNAAKAALLAAQARESEKESKA